MAGLLDPYNLGAGEFAGQPAGLLGNLGGMFGDNRNALIALGLGLASGNNWSEGIGNALKGFLGGSKLDRETKAGAEFSKAVEAMLGQQGGGMPPAMPRPPVSRPPVLPSVAPSSAPTVAEAPPAPPQGLPTGGGGAFGGMTSWAPGERPIDMPPLPPVAASFNDRFAAAAPPPVQDVPPPAPPPVAPPQAPAPPLPQGGPAQNPASIGLLLRAVGNPNLPQQQRDVAKILLTQALEATKMTEEQKNYVFYRAQGGKGSFLDFKKSPIQVDTGTEIRFLDPVTRQPLNTIPKNVAGTAEQTARGGEAGKFTDEQRKIAGFVTRMTNSEQILADPKVVQAATNLAQVSAGRIPVAGNYMVSTEFQKFEQAKRDFVNALLRRESGAVINPDEFKNANIQYFPQPGDSPEVIAQKALNRKLAIEGLRVGAGPNYQQSTTSGGKAADPLGIR